MPLSEQKNLRDELDTELITSSVPPSFTFILAAIFITYSRMGSLIYSDIILILGIVLIILPSLRLVTHFIFKKNLLNLRTTALLFKVNIVMNAIVWSLCTLLIVIEYELQDPIINIYSLAFSLPFAIATLITLIYDLKLTTLVQLIFILPIGTFSGYLYWKSGSDSALVFLYISVIAILFFLIQNRKVHQQIVNRIIYRIDSDNAYDELKESQKLLLLERSKVQQSTKAATIYEITGELTHEINNPLSIVIGNIEMALKSLSSGQVNIPYLEKKLKNSHYAGNRINNILKALSYLSTQNNNSQASTNKHDLNEIINQTLTHYREKLLTSHIQVEYDCPTQPHYILCKPSEITQVILNVLSNAVKALTETPSENRKIIIRISKIDNSKIKLMMSNTGDTISQDEQELLFEPEFKNKDSGYKDSLFGFVSSIGLSTTKNIVEEHGGNFYFDKNEKLTTFVVELPLVI